MSPPRRAPSSSAGFAIGPILFVLALLAIIGMVVAAGTGDFGNASTVDRIAADIPTQANLIRAKIIECNALYGTNANGDGYPDSTGVSVQVSTLNCTGDPSGAQNLWTGQRPAQLPPPTAGFGEWNYINSNGAGFGGTAPGGRCIWVVPTIGGADKNTGIIGGLTKAGMKFRSAASYTAGSEAIYNPASSSQKFVVWITYPTSTPASDCLP